MSNDNTSTQRPELHTNELLRLILEELKKLTAGQAAHVPAAADAAGEATDAELDAPYGDEELKAKMPRDWTGDDMKGCKMSECPPELLDLLAARHDFFAQKHRDANDPKKAGYEVRSARRARGWARRKRAGWQPPAPMQSTEIPFAGGTKSDDDYAF